MGDVYNILSNIIGLMFYMTRETRTDDDIYVTFYLLLYSIDSHTFSPKLSKVFLPS